MIWVIIAIALFVLSGIVVFVPLFYFLSTFISIFSNPVFVYGAAAVSVFMLYTYAKKKGWIKK